MDVDGTLTDGRVYMNGDGDEYKGFHVRDGYGIVAMIKSGIEVAFISGRHSPATERRARNLGVSRVSNGAPDKLAEFVRMAGEIGAEQSECVFIGDDVQDISCMEWAGLGIAVGDAHEDAKAAAGLVTAARGGEGAVREAAEYILRLNETNAPT
jgi:3-deoxy-D-manno-octulosonate 8-phosphate phosphatase (KDO 8-P phosphatase)